MELSNYEPILREEFDAEEGSFLLRFRCDLIWDKAAFSRLATAMEACAQAHKDATSLPRWIAEGFWFTSFYVRDWSSHPNFPREYDAAYYEAAYQRLQDLAFSLFVGEFPYSKGNSLSKPDDILS